MVSDARLVILALLISGLLAGWPAGSVRASSGGCAEGTRMEQWVCPEDGEASAAYIVKLFSDPDTNGIAVTFTDAGMEYALDCDGAAELAAMTAGLYERLPESARAEPDISWAIAEMTGEIRGHAIIYRTAFTDLLRERANPVNIVFPEYRGVFPSGAAGLSARAQHLYYSSLCD